MKKYVNNSFINKSPLEYKNGTAAVTNLPVTIYTDGQPVSSYTLKGNTSVSGTPSPQNPVTIEGVGEETANLLDSGSTTYTVLDVTITANNGYYTLNGQSRSGGGRGYHVSKDIMLDSGTYVMKLIGTAEGVTPYIQNGTTIIGYNGYAFTLNEPTSIYLGFNFDNSKPYFDNVSFGVMLIQSSTAPTTFEPYGYKISILKGLTPLTPIYVSQPLYLYSTYADELSSSGAVTYNLDTLAFDGTENWQIFSSTTSFFYCTASRVLVTKSRLINSHGFEINAVSNGTAANQNLFRVYATNDYSTVEDFKQFLITQKAAGTPLTVLYIPATPTTETVTVPEITTTGGEVTIDVDTTVKPSELELTYHGWHEHQPLKRENGSWS